MSEKTATGRTIAPAVFIVAASAVAAGAFSVVAGDAAVAVWAMPTAVSELAQGLLIFLSAGGWGALALRRLLPSSAPKALRAFTACGLGLWLLSTAIMITGSLVSGALTPYVWWPVIIVGAVLAIAHGWPTIRDWKLSGRVPVASLIWLLAAAAVGIWLAGAVRPTGFVGMFYEGDAYDVLEYHLQLPRQFFDAGQITPLHNCFSYYPLGDEMLYLLAMCLRGGAYEGMYLATMLHGLHAAVAAAAIYLVGRGVARTTQDQNARAAGLFPAILLATVPGIIYLSWLAKTELAQVMYLTLALLWLRQWLQNRSWRDAICIGLMLGGACATKYIAIGIVAAPVLLVMAAAAARGSRGRLRYISLGQTLAAGLITILLLSPWLIRNAILVGNPVFPLAAGTLGKAYWTDEQVRRWSAGTGPHWAPPVPMPPGYVRPRAEASEDLLLRNLLERPFLSQPLLALSVIAIVTLALRRRAFELAIAGVLALQVVVWATMAHQLPWRFLIPAVVPMALLSGDLLAWVGRALARDDAAPARPLPAMAAGALLLTASCWNLVGASQVFSIDAQPRLVGPVSGQDVAQNVPPYSYAAKLPQGSRIMLIGDAKAFYFPPGTVYTPVFDPQPLEIMISQGLSGPQILQRLKETGVTHLWVDWVEIRRLAMTYGFPSSLSDGAIQAKFAGRPPSLPVLDELVHLGARPAQLEEHEITVYQLP